MTTSAALRDTFADIDIYLFDQLLRGRFDTRHRVLDAGCGDGRNLHYLLRAGFDCFAVDEDARAIDQARRRAAQLAPALPSSHFVVGDLVALPGTPRAWTLSSAARCSIFRTTRSISDGC